MKPPDVRAATNHAPGRLSTGDFLVNGGVGREDGRALARGPPEAATNSQSSSPALDVSSAAMTPAVPGGDRPDVPAAASANQLGLLSICRSPDPFVAVMAGEGACSSSCNKSARRSAPKRRCGGGGPNSMKTGKPKEEM